MKLAKKKSINGETFRKKLFWSLSCSLILLIGFYIGAVNMTALNGARWKEADRKLPSLVSEISKLDAEYLARKQRVTLSLAYETGFQDAKDVVFVRTLPGLVSLR